MKKKTTLDKKMAICRDRLTLLYTYDQLQEKWGLSRQALNSIIKKWANVYLLAKRKNLLD